MAGLEQEITRDPLVAELQAANRRLEQRLVRAKRKVDDLVEAVYTAARDASVVVGKAEPISRPGRDRRKAPEAALLHLTDWQLGKRTSSFNTAVCERRVKEAVRRAINIAEIHRAHHPVREVHLLLGGDLIEYLTIFHGQAWEVDATAFKQLFTASGLIEGAVLTLLKAFEHVHVYETWGNHGRIGKRGDVPQEDNLDRIICRIARDRLEAQGHMTWYVPEGDPPDWHTIAEIGDYRALLIHGHQVRTFGPTPVHGITKRVTDWASGVFEPFTDAYLGHFHRKMTIPLANGNSIYVTPSIESGSSYARNDLGSLGVPRQRLHFIHPRRGTVTAEYVLHVD